nr:prenyltransferase/squalene oxidase repeat-containing protein [uncultured Carboxylicivirga sp.]
MKETISIKMLKTLQKAKTQLSDEAIRHISDFVLSQMNDEHCFKNKGGRPDLYYTAFGWMLCFILGIKTDVNKMRKYLNSLDIDQLDLIHYAAFVRCSILTDLSKNGKIITWLSSLKSKNIKELTDFSGIPHDNPQSPYSKFIWLSLLEDTGNKLKDKATFLTELEEYRLTDGGYRNLSEGLGATTNATVAALSVLGQLKDYQTNPDVDFLKNLQQANGGFQGASASPVPDILSTATALFMLQCYGQKPKYDPGDFLEAHWLDSGGFCPTLIDETSDVEYTFYGLLALGTL